MKRAVAVLRTFLVADVGLEGGFLFLSTATGAVAASFVSPAGPWAVVAVMSGLIGLLLVRRAA